MKNRTSDGFENIYGIVKNRLDKMDIYKTRANNTYSKDAYCVAASEITEEINYESSVVQITEVIKTVFKSCYDEESLLIETAQSIHEGIAELNRLKSFKMGLRNKVRILPRRGQMVAFFWKEPFSSFWDPNPTKYYIGTLSDSLVFTPNADFFDLSEEERTSLEFPENWDISAIINSDCQH